MTLSILSLIAPANTRKPALSSDGPGLFNVQPFSSIQEESGFSFSAIETLHVSHAGSRANPQCPQI